MLAIVLLVVRSFLNPVTDVTVHKHSEAHLLRPSLRGHFSIMIGDMHTPGRWRLAGGFETASWQLWAASVGEAAGGTVCEGAYFANHHAPSWPEDLQVS